MRLEINGGGGMKEKNGEHPLGDAGQIIIFLYSSLFG
jgi:hypothetical protein